MSGGAGGGKGPGDAKGMVGQAMSGYDPQMDMKGNLAGFLSRMGSGMGGQPGAGQPPPQLAGQGQLPGQEQGQGPAWQRPNQPWQGQGQGPAWQRPDQAWQGQGQGPAWQRPGQATMAPSQALPASSSMPMAGDGSFGGSGIFNNFMANRRR